MKLIQIFRAGLHQPMAGPPIEFTERDLELAAHAYNAHSERRPAALCLGHPPNNAPSFGLVRRLVAAAGKLFAEVEPNETLVGLVRSHAFKKVSASFMRPSNPDNPVPGAFFLRHIGFLGAATPAVKGMPDPVFSDAGSGHICFADGSASGVPAELDDVAQFAVPEGCHVTEEGLEQYRRTLTLSRATGLSFRDAACRLEAYGGI